MRAVFRHEISSFFTGLTGYVFGAFLLVFAGIYTVYYNLKYTITNFEYVLSGMAFVFLIIVPILTMRVIAEERHQKTDQLLYSLPISMTKIVIGKYLALLVMFVIPVGIICLYPLILKLFGNVSLLTSYGSIAGFFFLGAALIAIGMFISSVTDNQAIAAGICFVVMLLNYFLSMLTGLLPSTAIASFIAIIALIIIFALIINIMTKSAAVSVTVLALLGGGVTVWYLVDSSAFEGLLSTVADKLSLFETFYTFVDGVFDLTSIVYFISIAAVFVFLSIQSMEKRRWN